jgi:hypothetical protein
MCDIWSVQFSENIIVPVLKSVTRKRLVKTVKTEDTSLCVCVCVCQ